MPHVTLDRALSKEGQQSTAASYSVKSLSMKVERFRLFCHKSSRQPYTSVRSFQPTIAITPRYTMQQYLSEVLTQNSLAYISDNAVAPKELWSTLQLHWGSFRDTSR